MKRKKIPRPPSDSTGGSFSDEMYDSTGDIEDDWPVEVVIDDGTGSNTSSYKPNCSPGQQPETNTKEPGSDVTQAGTSGEFRQLRKRTKLKGPAYKDFGTNSSSLWSTADSPLILTDGEDSTSCSVDSNSLVTSTSKNEHQDALKPYTCSVCDFKSKRADHLKRHMRSHTDEKPHACSICDFKSRRADHLKRHMTAHTSEMPYVCSQCDFKSKRPDHLKKHMIRHDISYVRTLTGEKPYACDLCEFKTSSMNSTTLKDHLRAHACTLLARDSQKTSDDDALMTSEHLHRIVQQPPFECSVCDSVFGLAKHLKQHMKTHSDARPFACDVCEYKCSEKGSLKKHMMIHTGEKPYSCSVCDYKCTQPGHLKRHMRSHTGEKPYECKMCDYKSSDPSHLKKHMKTHIGDMTDYQ